MWGRKVRENLEQIRRQVEANLRNYGIDIAVVDDSDFVGWFASATRVDEIYMSDVKSMVANVLKAKGPYEIRRLDVIDHGNKHQLQIGDDVLTLKTLAAFGPELAKLRGQFKPSGFVHMQHCDAAANKELLVELARIWRVSVYAGTGKHNPVYRFNFGDYVRFDPNGAVRPAQRPNAEFHETYIGMQEGESVIPPAREELSMKSSSTAAYDQPSTKLRLIK